MPVDRFIASIAMTFGTMFVVGASRAAIANVRWWKAGLEMLALGALVALLAFASGGLVARLVEGI